MENVVNVYICPACIKCQAAILLLISPRSSRDDSDRYLQKMALKASGGKKRSAFRWRDYVFVILRFITVGLFSIPVDASALGCEGEMGVLRN